MTSPSFVLATDLDGTFLGGSSEERLTLYRALAARDDSLLIFVTGRDRDFIESLTEVAGIPRPRYVVADVGTSVLDGLTLEPIDVLERPIAQQWNDAGGRVRAMLAGEPGLELQPTPFRHRVSYYYDPAKCSPTVTRKIEAAGFDALCSADRFLDVLPRGVAKGPTLMRLLSALRIDERRVLVAGDTLNDLSLFHTRLAGVAVGGSEPALLRAVADMPNVFQAERVGAGGITQAIEYFGFDR